MTARLGQVLFAASFAGLGILSLGSGDFALNWQPVPAGIPGREALAFASGVMLLGGGLGLLFKRTASLSALVLTVNVFVWLVLLRGPKVFASPGNAALWLGFGETLTLVAAGWILVNSSSANGNRARVARFLFGAALLPIGLSHLVYVRATADLIPTWLPFREALTYVTGLGHIAAGLGILFATLPRLAAALEAIMLALFAALVWAPRVIAAPANRFSGTALLITTAISGAAWIVASSLDDVSWGYVGWAMRRTGAARPSEPEVRSRPLLESQSSDLR